MSNLQTHPNLETYFKEFSFSNLKLRNLFAQAFQVEVVSSSNLYQDHQILDQVHLSN